MPEMKGSAKNSRLNRRRIEQDREGLLQQLEKARQKAEQLAMEEKKRTAELDAIFTALNDALLVFDLKGKIVGANPAALSLYGLNPVGLTRALLAKKVALTDYDNTPISIKGYPSTISLTQKINIIKPLRLRNAQGQKIPVLVSSSPIFRDDQVTGAVALIHDLSEQEKLEKQKDAFIAIASHELKTPLTTLKALIQLHQLQINPREPSCQSFVSKITNEVDKLVKLTIQLLDVSRIQAGQLELDRRSINLTVLVKEKVEEARAIFPSHRIIFRVTSPVKINADPIRLEQVLTNLISNAVKYSPRADKVLVGIRNTTSRVEVSIKDFGIGIKEEDQSKIFDRFYRISGSRGERFPGFGLGLYISSEIIKRHRGRMWVESREGQGSTFFFSLPKRIYERKT